MFDLQVKPISTSPIQKSDTPQAVADTSGYSSVEVISRSQCEDGTGALAHQTPAKTAAGAVDKEELSVLWALVFER